MPVVSVGLTGYKVFACFYCNILLSFFYKQLLFTVSDVDEANATVAFKFESTEPWAAGCWVQARYLLAQIVAALDKYE